MSRASFRLTPCFLLTLRLFSLSNSKRIVVYNCHIISGSERELGSSWTEEDLAGIYKELLRWLLGLRRSRRLVLLRRRLLLRGIQHDYAGVDRRQVKSFYYRLRRRRR